MAQLATRANVSRQRIDQALQNFEKPGIVRVPDNQIDVLDLERLFEYGREQI